MYKVILVIHVMTTLALIAIVLVQRSSSDGMGLSGSSSSNNFLSGRAAASFATRATAFLALIFILTSLSLGVITARNHVANGSIADKIKSSPVPASWKQDAAPIPALEKTSEPAKPSAAPASTNPAPAAPVPAVPVPDKPAAKTPTVPRPD